MRNTFSEKKKNMLNNFLKEHAYRLSQISSRGPNITIHPPEEHHGCECFRRWCSTAPPGALAYHWGSVGDDRWYAAAGAPA